MPTKKQKRKKKKKDHQNIHDKNSGRTLAQDEKQDFKSKRQPCLQVQKRKKVIKQQTSHRDTKSNRRKYVQCAKTANLK